MANLKAKIAEEEASNFDQNLVVVQDEVPSPIAKEFKLGKIGTAIKEGLHASVEETPPKIVRIKEEINAG